MVRKVAGRYVGVGQGVENKRLAKSVKKTRPSVKKCLLHSLNRLKVSYTVPEIETLISRPRRLPCTTAYVGMLGEREAA
jgi:hypothetical protein